MTTSQNDSITISLLDLNNAMVPLQRLNAISFRLGTAWEIKKRIKLLQSDIEIMQNIIEEKRKEKFGPLDNLDCDDKDLAMKRAILEAKLSKEFEREVTEFLKNQKIEIKNFLPIKLKDLGDISITSGDLINLDFFISDDDLRCEKKAKGKK